MDKKLCTLQPLLSAGVFEPGPFLSCMVGGVEYHAELGQSGEIFFEGKLFKSPSAFSVFVKRKINPGRKADDGWTSVKYKGEILNAYRGQLEQLLTSGEQINNCSDGSHSPLPMTQVAPMPAPVVVRQKRKPRPKYTVHDWSDEEGISNDVVNDPDVAMAESDSELAPDEELADEDPETTQVQARPTVASWRNGRNHQSYQADLEHTWLQCEHATCGKWRRVKCCDVPDTSWYCCDNKDDRFASCDVPQELPDAEIDRLLEEGAMARHVAGAGRPPLEECSPEEFEADLAAFLQMRGDGQLATFVRERRITCNNTPLDVYGLYREVVRRGGLVANERYDERGRWTGGVNFAGEVFPKMKNWTANNRATSVGNQLLNNYKKFLLAYEIAYTPLDVPGGSGIIRRSTSGLTLMQAGAERAAAAPGPRTVFAGGGGGGGGPGGGGQANNPPDALAFLAEVAGASDGQDTKDVSPQTAAPQAQQQPASRPATASSKRGGGELTAPIVSERKRRRSAAVADDARPPVECGVRRVAALQEQWSPAAAGATASYTAGQVLLAQDPRDLSRHWPVVVADVSELPTVVAQGGVLAEGSRGFPQTEQEAGSPSKQRAVIPVLVLGTSWIGWVDRTACRPYSLSAGQSATASAWSAIGRSSTGSSNGAGGDMPLSVAQQPLVACVRGLKIAAEYYSGGGGGGGSCGISTASGWVQSVSTAHTASRLLMLEGQLPHEALCNNSFHFWDGWRRTVQAATAPQQLSSQILMLAYQLNADLVKRGASVSMWEELQQLLGIGAATTSLPHAPSCLSVDEAVNVICDALDWNRIRRTWNSLSQVAGGAVTVGGGGSAEEATKPRRATGGRAGGKVAAAAAATAVTAGGGGALAQAHSASASLLDGLSKAAEALTAAAATATAGKARSADVSGSSERLPPRSKPRTAGRSSSAATAAAAAAQATAASHVAAAACERGTAPEASPADSLDRSSSLLGRQHLRVEADVAPEPSGANVLPVSSSHGAVAASPAAAQQALPSPRSAGSPTHVSIQAVVGMQRDMAGPQLQRSTSGLTATGTAGNSPSSTTNDHRSPPPSPSGAPRRGGHGGDAAAARDAAAAASGGRDVPPSYERTASGFGRGDVHGRPPTPPSVTCSQLPTPSPHPQQQQRLQQQQQQQQQNNGDVSQPLAALAASLRKFAQRQASLGTPPPASGSNTPRLQQQQQGSAGVLQPGSSSGGNTPHHPSASQSMPPPVVARYGSSITVTAPDSGTGVEAMQASPKYGMNGSATTAANRQAGSSTPLPPAFQGLFNMLQSAAAAGHFERSQLQPAEPSGGAGTPGGGRSLQPLLYEHSLSGWQTPPDASERTTAAADSAAAGDSGTYTHQAQEYSRSRPYLQLSPHPSSQLQQQQQQPQSQQQRAMPAVLDLGAATTSPTRRFTAGHASEGQRPFTSGTYVPVAVPQQHQQQSTSMHDQPSPWQQQAAYAWPLNKPRAPSSFGGLSTAAVGYGGNGGGGGQPAVITTFQPLGQSQVQQPGALQSVVNERGETASTLDWRYHKACR